MKIEHGCGFKVRDLPLGVSKAVEIKRCPVCGQWWKFTSFGNGAYAMAKINVWPNVRLITYRRRVRKLIR